MQLWETHNILGLYPFYTPMHTPVIPPLPDDWAKILARHTQLQTFQNLLNFLSEAHKNKHILYPRSEDIFKAFELCSFQNTRVVILGQDPYHGPGQAHGLSFSVPADVPMPPSLKNIQKALIEDLGCGLKNGDLSFWAQQGVLLLNAVLTVRAHAPASHQNKGWEKFTDEVITRLSAEKRNLVFLLWGNYAAQKSSLINPKHHLVLLAPHPSPLSAHRGFFQCRHFSQTNTYLKSHGFPEIKWSNAPQSIQLPFK